MATEWVANASGLICLGTSLTVYSAYRLVKEAQDLKIPIVISNMGPTRADQMVDMRYEERSEEIVPELLRLLSGEPVDEVGLRKHFDEK